MTLKYLLFLCRLKRIVTYDDLRYSLEKFPYRHISYRQGEVIKKGSLRSDDNHIRDYEIFICSKSRAGLIMSIESANAIAPTSSIHHLSIHPEFRGENLGVSCVKSFSKLIKYEKEIETIQFEERLWQEGYYQAFFNDTLGATLISSNPDIWQLAIGNT
jgi:ribosomal protein S18 acetylase RimI-like enzyme